MSVSIYKEFYSSLKLEDQDDIKKFFPQRKHNLIDIIASKIKRIAHKLKTGVWINEKKVFEWAATYKDQQVNELFKDWGVRRKIIRIENNMTVAKSGFIEMIKTIIKFIIEFFKDPKGLGAILPSSKYVGKEIVSQIPKDLDAPPRNIIELGAGTGVFTRQIIKRMNPRDNLVVVEYDHSFCEKLRQDFGHIPNVKIIEGDVRELKEDLQDREKFDYIVAAIPLTTFDTTFVNQVYDKIKKITKVDSTYSTVDYPWIAKLKSAFSRGDEKKRLSEIFAIKDKFLENAYKKTLVFRNIPPFTRVTHLKMTKDLQETLSQV
jgi:phospholipid N-methyltransferase